MLRKDTRRFSSDPRASAVFSRKVALVQEVMHSALIGVY